MIRQKASENPFKIIATHQKTRNEKHVTPVKRANMSYVDCSAISGDGFKKPRILR